MRRTYSTRTLAFSLLLGLATACGAGEEDDDGTDMVTPGVGAGDTTPWAGQTFILSIPEANWSEPMGLGAEIGPFVTPFLIRIDDAAGNLTLTTANAAGQQEMCNPTVSATAANVPYPDSQIGPTRFPMHVKHVTEPGLQVNAVIHDLKLASVLPSNEGPATKGMLTAVMDMRDLAPMFTALTDRTPDSVCRSLQDALGAPCTACPHDGAAYCLQIEAVFLGATPWVGELTPVVEGSTDPSCVGANEAAAPAL